MKNPIKIIFIILIVFCFSFILSQVTEARSGCCSSHGGVCGCRCCDGTPLSATCAPYYPGCSTVTTPRIYCGDGSCKNSETCSSCPKDCGACAPTKEESTKTDIKNTSDQSQEVVAATDTEESSNDWVPWVLGILGAGGAGALAYKIGKNKANK